MTKSLRPIAAFVVVAACVFAGPAFAQSRETEEVNRTISFQPGGSLRLKNFSGDVRITGTDSSEVTIHAVRRAPRERLDRIKLSIDTSGSRIVINANDREYDRDEEDNDNVVETTFEIRVPRQIDLDVTSFSSGITVEDVDGRHNAKTFSGDVQLLNVRGPLRAKTFSGDVDLRMSAGDGADVDFTTFSGDIRTDLPMMLMSKTRKRLRATVNGGGREVTIETFSGDVRLNH